MNNGNNSQVAKNWLGLLGRKVVRSRQKSLLALIALGLQKDCVWRLGHAGLDELLYCIAGLDLSSDMRYA